MKKKIIVLLSLVVVMSSLLCGCGKGSTSTKATIIDNQGNTVELSSKELRELENSNSASFREKYGQAEATIIGTVESVDSYWKSANGGNSSMYKITLKEGWTIEVVADIHPEVIDLQKGDTVEVTSTIQSVFIDVEMYHYGGTLGQGLTNDGTTIVVR